MSSYSGNHRAWRASLLTILIAGCASVPKTAPLPKLHPLAPTATAAAFDEIRSMVSRQSCAAQSLSASGNITVEQNGESNSASFSMKSKRLAIPNGDAFGSDHSVLWAKRIDSLSVEITGPFGIKVARFLASPQKYEFYDILNDQTLSGPTDRQSLEDLTHLNGISLEDMSDLIYGLASLDTAYRDSIQLFSDTAHHTSLVVREPGIATTAYDFSGSAMAGPSREFNTDAVSPLGRDADQSEQRASPDRTIYGTGYDQWCVCTAAY